MHFCRITISCRSGHRRGGTDSSRTRLYHYQVRLGYAYHIWYVNLRRIQTFLQTYLSSRPLLYFALFTIIISCRSGSARQITVRATRNRSRLLADSSSDEDQRHVPMPQGSLQLNGTPRRLPPVNRSRGEIATAAAATAAAALIYLQHTKISKKLFKNSCFLHFGSPIAIWIRKKWLGVWCNDTSIAKGLNDAHIIRSIMSCNLQYSNRVINCAYM